MNRYELGDPTLPQVRPHRLKLRAIWKALAHLDRRVGLRPGPLGDEFAAVECRDSLPFHDTAFFQPLRRVFADDVLLLRHKPPDGVEQLPHRRTPHCPISARITTQIAGRPGSLTTRGYGGL